jgi:hypothetical protein
MSQIAARTPPEIFDQIIDHLHADTKVLHSCALVCRSWLPATRHHKFQSVRLHSNNFDAFLDIIKSPWCSILSNVRHLDLTEGRGRFAYEKKWLNGALPHLRVFRLYSVTSLTVEELDWEALSIESRQVLLSAFPGLQSLSISYSCFGEFHRLADLLCAFPALKDLHLYAVQCGDDKDVALTSLQACPLSTLRKLEVHAGPVSSLLPWILSSNPAPHLSDVDFGCVVGGKAVQTTKRFLEALGSSVEHLKFCFGVVQHDDKGIRPLHRLYLPLTGITELFCDNVNLAHNDGIRSIQFESVALYATLQAMSFVRSVPLLFARLGSWCMEEVAFAFLIDNTENLKILDWDALALIFAQPQFSGLRRIRVVVNGKFGDKEKAAEWIRAKLPACEERGILELCYSILQVALLTKVSHGCDI